MRRSYPLLVGVLASFGLVLTPAPAQASLPELRLAPLKYTADLQLGQTKVGFIEASNPTGTTVRATLEVQGFRQINDRGELAYYDDARLSAGIVPALRAFDLGPREAVRIKFTIDPNALGEGGAYGVMFLRVSSGNIASSQINTTARIGTLFILNVGGTGTTQGQIQKFSLPRLQYGGKSLLVNVMYSNTGNSSPGSRALAFAPQLTGELGFPAWSQPLIGPFVFPGRTRPATLDLKPGNYFGPIPVTLRDNIAGHGRPMTRWMILISGFWTWLAPLLLVAISIGFVQLRRQPKPNYVDGQPRSRIHRQIDRIIQVFSKYSGRIVKQLRAVHKNPRESK